MVNGGEPCTSEGVTAPSTLTLRAVDSLHDPNARVADTLDDAKGGGLPGSVEAGLFDRRWNVRYRTEKRTRNAQPEHFSS
jgi:hypothetical protein